MLEFTHFACTSEDINNLAHGLALTEVPSFLSHLASCDPAFTDLPFPPS